MDQSFEPRCVGLLSPGWPVNSMANGIVSYVGTVRRGLANLGIDCHVLTANLIETTGEPGIHPIPVNSTSIYAKILWKLTPESANQRLMCAGLQKVVRRLHFEKGLQLLELEESFGWASALSNRSPVPLLVRLHGPWFLNGAANGVAKDATFLRRDKAEKAGIAAAHAITAPSQHVLDQTREHFRLPLAGAKVIANPVDPVTSEDRWKLADVDRNRIVFIGRFDRHKGGDTMIDAFAHIVTQFPEARLDFAGPDRGCIDSDGRSWNFKDYVNAKLREADRQKVTYHGFQPNSAVTQLRKRALVTVAPSRYETFGIAAAEAMMSGCPLVVCGTGALNELVQQDHNGLVALPDNGADVGEKLLALLRNPEYAAKLGDQAATDAAARYSTDVIARQTRDFYRDVLGEFASRSFSRRM
jgi:glycosyltransferase involved in cell wall biosynthesis